MIELPSGHQIGDPVWVTIKDDRKVAFPDLKGHIRYVTFATGKVRYGVVIGFGTSKHTTMHSIDSAFITGRDGEKVKFDFDNLS